MKRFSPQIIPGIVALCCLSILSLPAYAKTSKVKAGIVARQEKEKVVLLPMQVSEDAQNMLSQMQAAVVQGLEQKYLVYSGERVLQELKKATNKENHSAKHDCDETRCLQDIATAFQTENVAVVHITKVEGGYLLSLSIKGVISNEAVFDNSVTCEGCSVFNVIDKLKELGGVFPVSTIQETQGADVKAIDPETVLWNEIKSGDTVDDYRTYLSQYPKGKYTALAKNRIKKAQEDAANEVTRKELLAWQAAEKAGTESNYQRYINEYPQGNYIGLAQVRIRKLHADQVAKEEAVSRPVSGNAASDVIAEVKDVKGDCLACHAINIKVVGPAWKAVSDRYKGDAGAPAMLAAKVIKGGGGNWGSIAMTPHSARPSREEIERIIALILKL